MVDQLLVGALTWFHVVSVIGWSGAALTFLVSIRPSLPKLSAQANGELVFKLFPRFVKSVQAFTVFTLIFGPSLAISMNDGAANALDLITPWSRLITVGASIGVATFFVVFLLLAPTTKQLGRLIQQMQQNPSQPPPAQLKALQKRLAIGAPLSVVLLLSAEVFMVAAAQF